MGCICRQWRGTVGCQSYVSLHAGEEKEYITGAGTSSYLSLGFADLEVQVSGLRPVVFSHEQGALANSAMVMEWQSMDIHGCLERRDTPPISSGSCSLPVRSFSARFYGSFCSCGVCLLCPCSRSLLPVSSTSSAGSHDDVRETWSCNVLKKHLNQAQTSAAVNGPSDRRIHLLVGLKPWPPRPRNNIHTALHLAYRALHTNPLWSF
jgi:hypothetical protein